jgi:hypothetical protein
MNIIILFLPVFFYVSGTRPSLCSVYVILIQFLMMHGLRNELCFIVEVITKVLSPVLTSIRASDGINVALQQ